MHMLSMNYWWCSIRDQSKTAGEFMLKGIAAHSQLQKVSLLCHSDQQQLFNVAINASHLQTPSCKEAATICVT